MVNLERVIVMDFEFPLRNAGIQTLMKRILTNIFDSVIMKVHAVIYYDLRNSHIR